MGDLIGSAFINRKPVGEVTFIRVDDRTASMVGIVHLETTAPTDLPFPGGYLLSADSEILAQLEAARGVQIRIEELAIEMTVRVYPSGSFAIVSGHPLDDPTC